MSLSTYGDLQNELVATVFGLEGVENWWENVYRGVRVKDPSASRGRQIPVGNFTSTTAPMTWWTLPSLALSVEAKRWAMAGAKVFGWKARCWKGLRSTWAWAARAMPL
jgi:hypothetical protein